MTEFLTRSTAATILWWPILLRGALWVSIAFLTALSAELKDMSPEVIDKMTWIDWTQVWIVPTVAGLTAMRLFMDQSMSNHQKKIEGTK